MVANGLIDTGAILAVLDEDDGWHVRCSAAIRELNPPWMTSEAVLTELFHLVGHARHEMEGAWKFVRSGLIIQAIITDSELPEVHALMSKYWDRPMDFADATLVYLARRESLTTILTIDRADFETYRIEGKRKFRIFPNGRE
jgi:predicted nucleic acid-binding protein